MNTVLKVTMHVLGGLGVAAVLYATLAAPGFLSDQASIVHLPTGVEVTRR